jgi:serine/threonine-protein kinase RsbT
MPLIEGLSAPSADAAVGTEVKIHVRTLVDIVTARQKGRSTALALGFTCAEVTLITAAISEVARNIVDHAGSGEIVLQPAENAGRRGLRIVARDQGPGIPDITRAMQYGYSTRRGLGVGLPGAKWLVDDFELISEVDRGTTVIMVKWLAAL